MGLFSLFRYNTHNKNKKQIIKCLTGNVHTSHTCLTCMPHVPVDELEELLLLLKLLIDGCSGRQLLLFLQTLLLEVTLQGEEKGRRNEAD